MTLPVILMWVAFVAATAYGHVALKLATRAVQGKTGQEFWIHYLNHPWTISGLAAWATTLVLWVLILKKHPLSDAMSLSAIKYVLVAAAAVVWLGESVSKKQIAGMALITVGIFLVKTK